MLLNFSPSNWVTFISSTFSLCLWLKVILKILHCSIVLSGLWVSQPYLDVSMVSVVGQWTSELMYDIQIKKAKRAQYSEDHIFLKKRQKIKPSTILGTLVLNGLENLLTMKMMIGAWTKSNTRRETIWKALLCRCGLGTRRNQKRHWCILLLVYSCSCHLRKRMYEKDLFLYNTVGWFDTISQDIF